MRRFALVVVLFVCVGLFQVLSYRSPEGTRIIQRKRLHPLYAEDPAKQPVPITTEENKEVKDKIAVLWENTDQEESKSGTFLTTVNKDTQTISDPKPALPATQADSNGDNQVSHNTVPPASTENTTDVTTAKKIEQPSVTSSEVERKKKEEAVQKSADVSVPSKDPAAVITELLLKTKKIQDEIAQRTIASPDVLAKEKEKEEEEKIYRAQSAVSTNFIEIMKELNKEAKEKELKDFQRRATTTNVEPAILSVEKKEEQRSLVNSLKVEQVLNSKNIEEKEVPSLKQKIKEEQKPVEREISTVAVEKRQVIEKPPAKPEQPQQPPQQPPIQLEKQQQPPKKWFEKALGFLESDPNIIVNIEQPPPARQASLPQESNLKSDNVVEAVKEPVATVERPVAGKVFPVKEAPKKSPEAVSPPPVVTVSAKKEPEVKVEEKKGVFNKLLGFLESDPNIVVAAPPSPVTPASSSFTSSPPSSESTVAAMNSRARAVQSTEARPVVGAKKQSAVDTSLEKTKSPARTEKKEEEKAAPSSSFNLFGLFRKKQENNDLENTSTVAKPTTTTTTEIEYKPVIKVGAKRSMITGQQTPITPPPVTSTDNSKAKASPVFSLKREVPVAAKSAPPAKTIPPPPVTRVVPPPPPVKPVAPSPPIAKKVEDEEEDSRKKRAKGILGWFGVSEDEEARLATLGESSAPPSSSYTVSRPPSEPRPVAQKRREDREKEEATDKKKEAAGGRGLFGLFGNGNKDSSDAVAKVDVTRPVAPVRQVNQPVAPPKVVVKPSPPVTPPKSSPTIVKATIPPKPAVATPVTTTSTATTEPQKKSGGLFGWFGRNKEEDSSTPPTRPVVKATEQKTTTTVKVAPQPSSRPPSPVQAQTVKGPAAMNLNFQRMITKALNNDVNKITAFQKLTDNYRSGNLDSKQFITSIDRLFTSSPSSMALETVLVPLINELPEKDLSNKLKAAFDKYRREKEKEEERKKKGGGGGLFGLFGGKKVEAKEEKEVEQVKKTVVVQPVSPPPTAAAKPLFSFSKGSTAATPTTTPRPTTPASSPSKPSNSNTGSSAIVTVNGLRVPDRVPIAKKATVAKQLQLVNENKLKVKELFDYLVREIGETRVKSLTSDIALILSKDKFSEYDKLVKSLK
mmetsp:Transcript_8381/g.9153  ORF Transcript_8381/g.9153 Transcript_8381/m.9153 type:complete len:1137 (+) Transcript_8381:88-3498(+)